MLGTSSRALRTGSGISIQDIDVIQFCLQRIKGHSLGGSGHCLLAMLQLDAPGVCVPDGRMLQEVEGREVPLESAKTWIQVFFSYDTVSIELRCKSVN